MGYRLREIRSTLIKLSKLPRICFYCGEQATDREHVVPKVHVGELTLKVWSCRECNCIASSHLFDTVEDKLEFIQNRISVKYKQLLEMPHWHQDEIDELEGKLKIDIIAHITAKKVIQRRLKWQMTKDALIVISSLKKLGIGKDSVPISVVMNTIRESELRHCVSIEN